MQTRQRAQAPSQVPPPAPAQPPPQAASRAPAEVASGAPWWSGGVRDVVRALRGHESGLLGQGTRFAIAGATVMVVYLTTTTVLADVVRLPFELALAIGFCVGLMVHFTLQRRFVWVHAEDFALPLRHQAARYLTVAGIQYGLTAASTAVLPHALSLPTEVVYLATVAVITATNFVVFRNGIFHPKEALSDPLAAPLAGRDD